MPATSADGLACTPTQEDPGGGCPATHLCLQSGCAERCELTTTAPIQANGVACPAYQGPGVSLCIVTIGPMEAPTDAACGIFCDDSSGMIPGCMGAACDGTCPNSLMCLQHPNPQAPVGLKLCQ